jgi:hypothetical protein
LLKFGSGSAGKGLYELDIEDPLPESEEDAREWVREGVLACSTGDCIGTHCCGASNAKEKREVSVL